MLKDVIENKDGSFSGVVEDVVSLHPSLVGSKLSLLQFSFLSVLKKRPLHGYALRQIIEVSFGLSVAPSTSYKTLLFLEERKYAVLIHEIVAAGKARKIYSITDEGILAQQYFAELLERILDLSKEES